MPRGGAQEEFRITPEEDRFLRAFVRRHAGRYVLIAALLVGAGLWLALGSQRGSGASDGLGAELAELRAAHESLRTELGAARAQSQRLAAEIEGVTSRVESVDAAARRGGNLEERVAGALRRLERVESRIGEGEGVATGAPWELASLLERVEALQARQEQESREREIFEKSVLHRLYAVEADPAGSGTAARVPASPAP